MCLGRWHHQKEKEKGNGKEIVMGMQSIADFMVSLELPKQYFGEEFVIADKLAEEAQAFLWSWLAHLQMRMEKHLSSKSISSRKCLCSGYTGTTINTTV